MELIITEKATNPTICLNMIVKDESHIIRGTLEKLCDKIKFSYWVICDTGSTDNTKEIICDFFMSKNIPGELHVDTWRNFAHNRTLALQRAFKKTDLLLVFDADDEIVGNIEMPKVNATIYDEYYLKFGSAAGTSYTRVLLINNNKQFIYQSVLHEYICCLDPNSSKTIIEGNYYVISGRSGNRSLDPKKYLKDAQLLEVAHAEALLKKDPLYNRYAFYCANSYKDYGSYEDAIKWYKITLNQNNWEQEKYISCLYIYDCYERLNQKENGLFYLVKAFKYDTERVECLYPLLVHYCCENENLTAYNYYLQVRDFYENHYLNTNIDMKLFVSIDKYNLLVPYYMILIADRIQDFKCIIRMFEIVFIKKMPVSDDSYIGNLLYNLQFFVHHVKPDKINQFIELASEYIRFLHSLGIPLHNHEFLKNYGLRFGIDVSCIFNKPVTTRPTAFSKEQCESSKNILFFTGFANIEWNYSYSQNNALGGSEKAVAYLSRSFPKDYNIYITGIVANEQFENITYVKLQDIHNIINSIPFHTVIVSRYISFYEMFKECSYYQSYIWAHDTSLINSGCNLTDHQILKKWDNYITGCICLTQWHKDLFILGYPGLANKISIINNGIDLNSFPKLEHNVKKQSNKFIYSSRPERGLVNLLNLWPKITEVLPDAELVISNYLNEGLNVELMEIIKKHNNIRFLGNLNAGLLYAEMSTSEYWMYPTNWSETSCITALEILMSEVICLYYPIAGLPFTIDKYGIKIEPGNEIETLIKLTNEDKINLRENGKTYAELCSWKNRSNEWCKLLSLNPNTNNNQNFIINIINLNRRQDRKEKMIHQMNQANITNYEFFDAIDGKNTEPSMFIKKLFEKNNINYRKGEIGCALSHYKLWHKLINDDEHNYYVVLEDDVSIVNNFNSVLQKSIDIVSKNTIEYALIGGCHIHDKYTDIDIDNIKFNKIREAGWNCTYGYIISKSACYKLVKNIQTNGIKMAIDHTSIYMNCLDMYKINKYLIDSKSFQAHNNLDTDIQTDYEQFKFDNIPSYSIAFTDWWIEEYCGGTFDEENNYFKNMLSKYYNIHVIRPEQNPDILFYSIFGNNHAHLAAGKKVFYSGESYSQREDADFNITFDKNSSKNCRLPLWTCYLDPVLFDDCYKKKMGLFKIPNKSKFCSIICQIDSINKERSEMVNKLSKYKQVDCGGQFLNNIGYIVPRGTNCSGKIEYNNSYKFVLTFENKIYPGYVTEKICDAYKSRCIPIYWGSNEVVNDFNPKTFINANDFSSFDELVEYIKKVDNDQELYESYFEEPIFSNYWLTIFNDFDQTFFSDLVNNIVSKTNLKPTLYKLSICLLIQNETEHLQEWLEHYINQGAEHFFIVSNNSTDNVEEFINTNIYRDYITLIIDTRESKLYENSLNHKQIIDDNFYEIVKNRTRWAIIVDIDEFMFGKNGYTLSSYIDTIADDIGCVYVYWSILKSDIDLYDRFSIKNPSKRINLDLISTLSHNIKFANKFGKSLFRTSMLNDNNKLWMHKIYTNGKIITNYNIETNYSYDNMDDIPYSESNYSSLNIALNHYVIRNVNDYNKKSNQLKNAHRFPFVKGIIDIHNLDNQFCVDDNIIHSDNDNNVKIIKTDSKFKIIGFHSNQLCERGTEVAMYDYAYYNEKMYGNKSIIFYCKHNPNNDVNVIKKFELKFKCYAYDNFLDIEQIINNEKIDYFYNCKSGSRNDNQLIKSCPNLIHAVFTVDPHGERYATISKSLSKKHNNTVDYVPHMLNLPSCHENMRHQLNIPNDAVVMGRYGGYYQFDIQIAHEAIKTILNTETNLYFVFANTNVFYKHPRIIYLDKIIDLENKVKFINTCDVMIHARSDGETFGLAVGEFSSCGKPVITCKSHIDNAHIDILGEKAIIFNTEESLVEIFKNIKYIINSRSDWNAFGDYTPENVMTKFFKVFIE
jgi:GR25 family glycosyltransferase involved in LPS biosynthesis/tetratricopeptide (TPR) repeat protein